MAGFGHTYSYDYYSYQDVQRLLEFKRARKRGHMDRIMAGSRTRWYMDNGDGSFSLEYHGHPLVTLWPDRIVLDNCGWSTRTTRSLLEAYTPRDVHLYSEYGVWMIVAGNTSQRWSRGPWRFFKNGTTLRPVTDGWEVDTGFELPAWWDSNDYALLKMLHYYGQRISSALRNGRFGVGKAQTCPICVNGGWSSQAERWFLHDRENVTCPQEVGSHVYAHHRSIAALTGRGLLPFASSNVGLEALRELGAIVTY